jgi:hypothetical protein
MACICPSKLMPESEQQIMSAGIDGNDSWCARSGCAGGKVVTAIVPVEIGDYPDPGEELALNRTCPSVCIDAGVGT